MQIGWKYNPFFTSHLPSNKYTQEKWMRLVKGAMATEMWPPAGVSSACQPGEAEEVLGTVIYFSI